MYIIIAGGGFIGKTLAKQLVEQKHDVVVIESDVEACEEIYAKYGAVTIHGNLTDLGVLESACIKRCDVAVATTRHDSDNLAFALLSKHHNVSQIIVRMSDPRFEDIYKAVGVTNIARGKEFVINQMLVNIEIPELRGVITLGDIEMCIYNLPEDAKCAGQKIMDLTQQEGFPQNINIACVFQDPTCKFCVAKGPTELQPKDRLFICGTRDDIRKAIKFLR